MTLALVLFGCSSPAGVATQAAPGLDTANPGDSGADTDSAWIDPMLEFEARVGITTIAVPPGEFVMGSPTDEVGRLIPPEHGGDGSDREVQHRVTLTHELRVADREVTQASFTAIMGYNPSTHASCGPDCPVETITWHQAAAFTAALSVEAGVPPCYVCEGEGAAVACSPAMPLYDCSGYRLPTEAEWEYFARAGETGAFLGGGGVVPGSEETCAPDLTRDNGRPYSDDAWWCGNSTATAPVAQKPPNTWGLYDVEGNVHEWTNDWYDSLWYTTEAASLPDPTGPDTGAEKVRRGGGWTYEPWRLRLAYRGWHTPVEPNDAVGLRIVRASP